MLLCNFIPQKYQLIVVLMVNKFYFVNMSVSQNLSWTIYFILKAILDLYSCIWID